MSPPRCPIRAVVVLLGLLSVVLLARLLGWAVQHKTVLEKTVSMDRDMEQLPLRLKNVTERHTTVSMDRDMEQPPQRLKDVTEQRDTLLCQQVCQGGWDKFGCKCSWLTRGWGSWNNCRKLCVTHGAG